MATIAQAILASQRPLPQELIDRARVIERSRIFHENGQRQLERDRRAAERYYNEVVKPQLEEAGQ